MTPTNLGIMNTKRFISTILLGALLTLSLTGCGGDAKKLQAENDALRAEVAAWKSRTEAEGQSAATRDAELKKAREANNALRVTEDPSPPT